jgi:HD-like signal output (HDOD) protein
VQGTGRRTSAPITMDLDHLLAGDLPLPSMPKSVALLLSELAREQPDLRKLNQLFAGDPGLAARLLRQANRPLQPPSHAGVAEPVADGIASIAQALAVLPIADLRPLATAAATSAGPASAPGLALPQFWRYSVHVAKLARALAAQVRQSQAIAYTAGLVHAIGELVLQAVRPQEMAALNAAATPLDLRRGRLELRRLGYSYAEVGAGLAQRWGFPAVIVDALAHQAAPFERDAHEPLAGLLNLAAWRARAREAHYDDKALATSFPGEVGLLLGLDIDMVLQQDPFDWAHPSDEGAAA